MRDFIFAVVYILQVKLLLEETPQGGLSCPYGAIHLQLAAKPTDEVAAERRKRQQRLRFAIKPVLCIHLIHRKRSPFPSRGRLSLLYV